MLLDSWTWPYYYVEIANENLKWKNTLEWILIVLFSIFLILILIRIFRFFLSKHGKSRFELVEVIAVSQSIRNTKEVNVIVGSKSKVIVKFQEKKLWKKRVIRMDSIGIHEGDVGILEYKGDCGISFVKKESRIAEKETIYYKFGFNKNNKQEIIRKERKVRKYW